MEEEEREKKDESKREKRMKGFESGIMCKWYGLKQEKKKRSRMLTVLRNKKKTSLTGMGFVRSLS